MAEIGEQMADPACRLLTLLGPGGVGKTRLAIRAAELQAGDFDLGALFVPLAGVSAAEIGKIANPLVIALADALNFAFQGSGEPGDQLLTFLEEKAVLLVLDNFEHLLSTVEFVAAILSHAPRVKILVTSRRTSEITRRVVIPRTRDGLSRTAGRSARDERQCSAPYPGKSRMAAPIVPCCFLASAPDRSNPHLTLMQSMPPW